MRRRMAALAAPRDQLHTRSAPRFAQLRAQVYAEIQRARGDLVEVSTGR